MAASKKTSPSDREQIEASQLIDGVVNWASSAPGDMEIFSLRVSDPEPGVVAALQETAEELQRQGEYDGATAGHDSYVGRIAHIVRASGLNPTELAEELDVPRSTVYRWTKSREDGGAPPSYSTLEKFNKLAKRHGIPGDLLDDSCCLPMTVELLGEEPTPAPAERPVWAKPPTKRAAANRSVLVTFSSAAIQLLKDRSRNVGQKVVASMWALSDCLMHVV